MSQALIDELKQENLCTHFVLPLFKLNKFSFIASNFVNCYLTRDGRNIVVHILDPVFLSRKTTIHPEYRGMRTQEGQSGYFLLYNVPVKWRADVRLFIEGKFSRMSKAAKETIVRYSGLPYEERTGKRTVTDGRLLALEQHPVLKSMWERELWVTLDQRSELLSIPGNESFIDLSCLRSIAKEQS